LTLEIVLRRRRYSKGQRAARLKRNDRRLSRRLLIQRGFRFCF
jgi:hypothetical protein